MPAAGPLLAILAEKSAGLVGAVGLAAGGLGHALFEALVDGLFVAGEPVLLRFEQIEGAVDEFGGFAVGAARELSLDALLRGGIEGERHGVSIARGERFASRIPAHAMGLREWSARPIAGCAR